MCLNKTLLLVVYKIQMRIILNFGNKITFFFFLMLKEIVREKFGVSHS